MTSGETFNHNFDTMAKALAFARDGGYDLYPAQDGLNCLFVEIATDEVAGYGKINKEESEKQ